MVRLGEENNGSHDGRLERLGLGTGRRQSGPRAVSEGDKPHGTRGEGKKQMQDPLFAAALLRRNYMTLPRPGDGWGGVGVGCARRDSGCTYERKTALGRGGSGV